MKIHKKSNWIRQPSITCSRIWHFDILKCVHWSDTKSVKVWWRYYTYTSDMNNTHQLCMKIPQKCNKTKWHSIHLAYWYIKICVLIRRTFYESLLKIYVLPNTKTIHFFRIFSDIGQCFWPAQTKRIENQKSGHVRII